jgi:exopolyphosphatase / guanosine-5'-triphosphate,3'-diphosphate pyrophosphatase
MTVRRVAAIDCGTNSIRLLVADVDADTGSLVDVDRRMEVVRLGEGVDRAGVLSGEALARTFDAVDRYATRIDQLGVQFVRFVATSATRDAANRDVFVSGVRGRLGVEPEVVSGDEEAALSFAGATHGLAGSEHPTPYLVVDIGGGSTEFVLGDLVTGPTAATSVDIGCVRMTERHFRTDPPLPAEVSAARDDIDAAIATVARTVPLRRAGTMIGLAGSVTTVAALAHRLWEYDPALIHGSVTSAAEVHRTCEDLLYMTREKRAALPVMHPGRVDVIMAGALILSAVVAYTGLPEIIASEHDILDGIALGLG